MGRRCAVIPTVNDGNVMRPSSPSMETPRPRPHVAKHGNCSAAEALAEAVDQVSDPSARTPRAGCRCATTTSSAFMSEHFQNQSTVFGTVPSFAFVREPDERRRRAVHPNAEGADRPGRSTRASRRSVPPSGQTSNVIRSAGLEKNED